MSIEHIGMLWTCRFQGYFY